MNSYYSLVIMSKVDPVTFLNLVGDLKKIPRTGWLHHGLINVESIAEHTFRVSILAFMLADDLDCDRSKLVEMALIHDIAEIKAGDIVAEHGTQVDVQQKATKFEKEKTAMTNLSQISPNGKNILKLWEEYEHLNTREAKILKQLDKLEMAMQALEYENPRNPNHLKEFWENIKMHINEPLLLNIFKEICKRRTPPYNNYDLIGSRFA